jgi:hydroxymethylglutaryl-CoA lyase
MTVLSEDQPRLPSAGIVSSPTNDHNRRERDVVVVEVGPRDGLQNEAELIATETKVEFIDALAAAGLPVIEATSFVNPRAVPQLADADEVMARIRRPADARFPVLIPNSKGLERALAVGVDAIALFTSATEAFAEANVGTSIDGTFERFADVVDTARERALWIRGYVSVAFGCPFSGSVTPQQVVAVAERLLELGCTEVCLADTIGVATPDSVDAMLREVSGSVPINQLAVHFHDTSGQALSNVAVALQRGVRTFDSAVGGLGGCPFAPGSPGNLATEHLLRYLKSAGLESGVDLDAVSAAGALISPYLSRNLTLQT